MSTERTQGQAGTDIMTGGLGNDIFWGGAGSDVLSGGPGIDKFVIQPSNDSSIDIIMDFSKGEDKIYLVSFDDLETAEGLTMFRLDIYLIVDLDEYGGGKIALDDYAGELDASDFIIA